MTGREMIPMYRSKFRAMPFAVVANASSSILCLTAIAAHSHDLRIELCEDFHEVLLRGHDLADALVDAGHFIAAGAEDVDASLGELLANVAEAKHVVGRFA